MSTPTPPTTGTEGGEDGDAKTEEGESDWEDIDSGDEDKGEPEMVRVLNRRLIDSERC